MSIPVFAVLGHPNEGKSSVVSTLAEDESVPVSETPGETKVCQSHSILLEGRERLRLVDTPGFQNPAAVLEAFQAFDGSETQLVEQFIASHAHLPLFHHDLELLKPLRERAAILYVCDASRPLREMDRQEMEILRLTGLPRMALLNCKQQGSHFLESWREAASRQFNLTREFNAHQARFPERLKLLEALKTLTPLWDTELAEVVTALRRDWDRRVSESLLILESLLQDAARHVTRKPVSEGEAKVKKCYRDEIRALEAKARAKWRQLFHHPGLPDTDDAALQDEDLFAERVWRLLGFSRRQLTTIGAVTGGLAGLGADAATGGLSFGILTGSGAVVGALSGWMGGPKLGAKRLPWPGGKTLARESLQVGPYPTPQLSSILIDRSLLYLHALMQFAHARRNPEAFLARLRSQGSFVADWSDADQKTLKTWHRAQSRQHSPDKTPELRPLLAQAFQRPPPRFADHA